LFLFFITKVSHVFTIVIGFCYAANLGIAENATDAVAIAMLL
jgi:hypothetical protein